jgi:hypothetical protein
MEKLTLLIIALVTSFSLIFALMKTVAMFSQFN